MLQDNCCLAVDAMGGDFGPHLTVPAAVATLHQYPSLRLYLVGDESLISPQLQALSESCRSRIDVVHTEQVVAMDDKPAWALRHKRESSLWRALQLVADGRAQACVSAGNTGALMAMSMMQLGLHEGIERPAICTAVPTYSGKAYLLDMGANVDCSAQQLWQFALMAAAMARLVDGIDQPRVGLLNIGRESTKGDAVVQQAAQLIAADQRINYVGFVEGDGIFSGHCDVVVCDGFAGNVALKASEGVARMIATLLRQELDRSLPARLGALLSGRALTRLRQRIDPALYNGASLLGLKGVVIKSHGGASPAAFQHALGVAITEVDNNVPQRIGTTLSDSLQG